MLSHKFSIVVAGYCVSVSVLLHVQGEKGALSFQFVAVSFNEEFLIIKLWEFTFPFYNILPLILLLLSTILSKESASVPSYIK